MAEAAPVREGDLLAGKYRVERVLGSGGMGVVVAAVHEQLEQRVALKFVREEALDNQDAVQRFLREARASVKLKSEYAARVIDVGTLESGAPYMVMEYLEGSDLAAVLEEHGALSVESAVEWIVQACEAIAEAHAMGIIHRDIKPQNLFLARTVGGQAKVKVLDFGVSKSMTASGGVGGLTQTRAMLGSPLYMSPEQMRSSRDVDARSDVWALGVVLYELLTRRWPFEAESMPELCLKVVSDPPLPITAYRDVPPLLVEVIAKCLEKDPLKRYANAAELAAALEPLAPPASKVVVERARLAISTMRLPPPGTQASVAVVPPSARSGPHPALPDVLARTAPTPATWDSASGKSEAARKSNRGVLVAAVVVGIVLLAGGVFALRGRGGDTNAATATPTTPIVATPVPTPSAAAVATLPPPAAPPATDTPTPSAAASVAATPTAKPAVGAATGPARPGAVTKPGASARPKPTDDDIPSLR